MPGDDTADQSNTTIVDQPVSCNLRPSGQAPFLRSKHNSQPLAAWKDFLSLGQKARVCCHGTGPWELLGFGFLVLFMTISFRLRAVRSTGSLADSEAKQADLEEQPGLARDTDHGHDAGTLESATLFSELAVVLNGLQVTQLISEHPHTSL